MGCDTSNFVVLQRPNGFINNANNDGESGHPGLVPLWSVIGRDIIPLVVTCSPG